MTSDPQFVRLPGIRARIVSWMAAGVVLLLFCWLGSVTPMFTQIFKGMEKHLPTMTRFSMAYGQISFPIVGVLGAAGIILAERIGRRQLFQAFLFAALVALAVILFRSLIISGVWMSSLDR